MKQDIVKDTIKNQGKVDDNVDEPVMSRETVQPAHAPIATEPVTTEIVEEPGTIKKTKKDIMIQDTEEGKGELSVADLVSKVPQKNRSSASREETFDGDSSVSKLRAMFDSPESSDNKKSKRKWKPRKVAKAIAPVNLEEGEKPEKDETTAARQEKSSPNLVSSAQPSNANEKPTTEQTERALKDSRTSRIVMEQAMPNLAPMTTSVHDIDTKIVALVSLFPESMYEYLPRQSRAMMIFKANKIDALYVDGSNPDEKARRNELFEISGLRGVYPQLFVRNPVSQKLEFFADYERIELLNDCDDLLQEIKAATER